MKKYIWPILFVGVVFLTACNVDNNTVTDNNDDSDLNPTDDVAYQTMTCTKNEVNSGVTDQSSYIVKHDGENVKSITMRLHYSLDDETGSDAFEEDKTIFSDFADAFMDVVGVTTNVIEDSASLYRAEAELAVDEMQDEDFEKFDDFKISRSVEEQRKNFEDAGMTCE